MSIYIATCTVKASTDKINITYTDVRASCIVTSSICMTRIPQTLVYICKIHKKQKYCFIHMCVHNSLFIYQAKYTSFD